MRDKGEKLQDKAFLGPAFHCVAQPGAATAPPPHLWTHLSADEGLPYLLCSSDKSVKGNFAKSFMTTLYAFDYTKHIPLHVCFNSVLTLILSALSNF